MPIDPTQGGVLRRMAAAAAITVVTLGGAVWAAPALLLPPAPLAERLAWTLAWESGVLVCLIVAVAALARHRFFAPADIDGGGLGADTPQARRLQSVLQNTLEQTVIAVLAHLLWAATMPRAWQAAVPAAVALFVLGRIGFARGYAGGAVARAAGFALTFYPSVTLAAVAVASLLWRAAAG